MCAELLAIEISEEVLEAPSRETRGGSWRMEMELKMISVKTERPERLLNTP
jgi:hypothetical protein